MKCAKCSREMKAIGLMGQPSVDHTDGTVWAMVAITNHCDECDLIALEVYEQAAEAAPIEVRRAYKAIDRWLDGAMNTLLDQIEKEYGIDSDYYESGSVIH